MQKPEYEFDTEGHTIVKGSKKHEHKATTPEGADDAWTDK
jgi:hypothetical protein